MRVYRNKKNKIKKFNKNKMNIIISLKMKIILKENLLNLFILQTQIVTEIINKLNLPIVNKKLKTS
jgi:hypothetical protein